MHLFLFSFLPLFKEILNVVYDKPRQYIEKQSHHFADKGLYSQNYGFSSSHVWIWELAHKEAWAPKNWCFWIVVVEKTLDSKDIKAVNPKENQLWIFTGRIDVEAGASVLCPPDMSSWLIGEDPDTGKGWRQKKKGAAEDEWLDSITNSMNIIWATSRRWWRTGKPSMLQCMGLQRVRHDLATEQQLITTQSPEWLKLKQKNIWFYRWNAKQVLSQSASASIAQ